MGTDDLQLLIKTHRGHEASARLLWDRHAPRLLAHAKAIVRDSAAAADIVQTVMCRVLELPGVRVREVRDVPAFLATAVRREALNHVRAARRERARRGVSGSYRTPSAPASIPLDVQAAVEALPRRLREVIVLKHISDLTLEQIATALVTNRNTVASRYRAAVAALRNMLRVELPAVGAAIEPAIKQGAIHA